jgi:DNA-binding LacI/PurR family transcriptional regulator
MTEVSNRRIGFIDELKNHGITNIINIEYPLGDYQTVPEMVYGEVIDHPEIDGIFCNNDNIAAEVVRRLEAAGRHVPSQVKVIGFDGGTEGLSAGSKGRNAKIASYRSNSFKAIRLSAITEMQIVQIC